MDKVYIEDIDIIHKTVLFKCKIGLEPNIRNRMIEDILALDDEQNRKTNVKASMSSWQLWNQIDCTEFGSRLIDVLDNHIIWNRKNFDENSTTRITNLWSAVYQNGDKTDPHDHSPLPGSFVYYLKASENSSPLFFNDNNLSIVPEEDLLIVFPGYIIHSVPESSEKEKRIVIAGNFTR
jgi:hypothetical protein